MKNEFDRCLNGFDKVRIRLKESKLWTNLKSYDAHEKDLLKWYLNYKLVIATRSLVIVTLFLVIVNIYLVVK